MSITHRVLEKDLHLLKLSQPLSGRWATELKQKFQDAYQRGAKRVVVDLEDVAFIDSQGLATLIAGYKIFGREKQNFLLAALQDQPKLLFELTMFNRVFQIFDTVAEAQRPHLIRQTQLFPPVPTFAPQAVA